MALPLLVLPLLLLALEGSHVAVHGATVEHTFYVRQQKVRRLCEEKVITTVNGQWPGPTIETHTGDTVVVHVINESPHGITIHWHGVIQRFNCWADGVGMITQCPLAPGNKQTYRFNVTEEEGTLWWHAHVTYLRTTVHGAIVIRPKDGAAAYPFPRPDDEVVIVLGEWWKTNMTAFHEETFRGIFTKSLNAYTINGKTGDLYPCSNSPEDIYKLEVAAGKTYLLRIINGGLQSHFFFKIAGHSFTVVAADASYTKPYATDVIAIAPGQTVDALMTAAAPAAAYYMVAQPYIDSVPPGPYPAEKSRVRGVLRYASAPPARPRKAPMPTMPAFHDPPVARRFHDSLTALADAPRRRTAAVPKAVDERIFVTVGLGVLCPHGRAWCAPSTRGVAASMNNVSFLLPREMSLLEAHYRGAAEGVYTRDFPDVPPLLYNFTDVALHDDPKLDYYGLTSRHTEVKRLRYGSAVELVLQSTAVVASESHPIHLHGHSFFVLASGHGVYDREKAEKLYNLVDPVMRNTVPLPLNGWAVIRFVANNPGIWFMHCHMDTHQTFGMAMAFEVENGPTPETSLPPPPEDLPSCASAQTKLSENLRAHEGGGTDGYISEY